MLCYEWDNVFTPHGGSERINQVLPMLHFRCVFLLLCLEPLLVVLQGTLFVDPLFCQRASCASKDT
jgi:hypothetical protein